MPEPKLIGTLSAHYAKGKKAFSFEYDKEWIRSEQQRLIDPDIQFFSGSQFPNQKENFGVFLDSMPDTWGRTLMKRRAAQQAREQGERTPTLYDSDYLLAVYDESRMGALRFKTKPDGPFLDDNINTPTPPWSSIHLCKIFIGKTYFMLVFKYDFKSCTMSRFTFYKNISLHHFNVVVHDI